MLPALCWAARDAADRVHGWVVGRRRAVAVAVVTVAVTAGVVASRVAVRIAGRPDAVVAAVTVEMQGLADTLRTDLTAGSASLPSTVVRHVTVADDHLSAAGTIARPVDGGCVGFTVVVTDAWLVDGDPAGLVIGPVGPLPTAACDL